MSTDLIDLVHRLGRPKVLVVGDIMLDRYVWGDAERISQEAPVILLRADRREERLGGASSVATMLSALQAEVLLAGVVGADPDASRVLNLLAQQGIDSTGVLTDSKRPTTVKERYIGRAQHKHPQQMLRVDYEERAGLDAAMEARFRLVLPDLIEQADVVLISDYAKGVCTPLLTQLTIELAQRHRRPVLADPLRCTGALEPHPYLKYTGCTTITPNRLEASLATGLPVRTAEEALAAADRLRQRFDLEAGIVTLDKDGMALAHADGRRLIFPTRQRQVYDITGAGDMVLSILGLALAAGADYESAIRLANVAGGLEVEKIGVAPVTREELLRDIASRADRAAMPDPQGKLLALSALIRETQQRRQQGARIVFTNGCFDVLHAGHVQYLQEARAQGDLLIVGLNSDFSVRALKGPARPIHNEAERVAVLSALTVVDYVTIFDAPTPLELIRALRPDVLVKGADYRKDQVVGANEVESWGGRVHLASLRAGLSTTEALRRLAA